MHLKPLTIFKIKQVMVLTIAWIIAGVFVELNNAVNYNPHDGSHFTSFVFGKSLAQHLAITAIGPLLGGLVAGSFIVFYQREKLRRKSYLLKLLIHSLIYISFVIACIVVVGLIGALKGDAAQSYEERFYKDVFSLRIFRLIVTWYFIVLLTIFILDVSEKYGTATLGNLLLGRYHSTLTEDRIFMFLDMKSSTTIAESLGEEKYFKMLHFFFQMANETIINHFGEIYQYVGDEIIVSWNKKEDPREAHPLTCFFAIQSAIKKNAKLFIGQFGVVPEFKAGIHCGKVASGLIGTVRKDIVYSGDVLNAAARIVALCNEYEKDLIVSETVYALFKTQKGFQFSYLDTPLLRGKTTALALYAVSAGRG